MDRHSGQTHFLNLPSLLLSAEHRRNLIDSDADLMDCILHEACEALNADYVLLWELPRSQNPRIVWKRGDYSGNRSCVTQIACGVVKQFPHPTGKSGTMHFGYMAACLISEGHQLLLEVGIPGGGPDPQEFVDFTEILADLFRRKLVSLLGKNARQERDLLLILTLLHSDLDPIRIANCVASDTAELLRCDRVSVARRKAFSSWELVASTAVGQPDPRADATQSICRVIGEKVLRVESGDGLQLGARTVPQNPDEQGSQLVVPLIVAGEKSPAEWAAFFEWKAEQSPEAEDKYLVIICRHAALAFRNAAESRPISRAESLHRFKARFSSRRGIGVGVLAIVCLACLVFLPVELRIEVNGRLIPSKRSFVFAPEDGVITEVFVEDGSSVERGASLCQLRNEDLEIQREAIEGEVNSLAARLAALESLRGDRSLPQSGLLSAEYAELKERLGSFQKRGAILNDRLLKLSLKAYMAGKVYGDRLQELLQGRPVQRGQYLFELADPENGWQLDFRIPERDARHVLEAQARQTAALHVTYAMETDPERVLRATISSISASTDVDEYGRLSTLATAIPEAGQIRKPRPGAGMVGHVRCGRHSAGYVLFRRVIEAVQRGWWL